MLSKLNSREKKIITLEDPIEYELGGIIQAEVDEKNGFSFQT
jgi:type II secretory ATPase GspE/PulE/Tfp pilus assembly ATPase PilB-like protein